MKKIIKIDAGAERYKEAYKGIDLGWIGHNKKVYNYYSCREEFQNDYWDESLPLKSNRLIIFHGNLCEVKKIIQLVENKVKVPLRQRATYFLTNSKKWIAINPKWWVKNQIRISLFTILLRASKKCNNLRDLYKFKYLKSTKQALDLFLKGNTNCTKCAEYWVDDLEYYPDFKLYNHKIKYKNVKKINLVQKFMEKIRDYELGMVWNDNDIKLDVLAYHIVNMIN